MNIPDMWSLVTGLASLVSLLIALNEKMAGWRKYTIPFGCGLAGFAIGRISPGVTPQDSGFIMLIFLIVALAFAAMVYMLKHQQVGFAYALPMIILLFVLPTTIKSYNEANPRFSRSDLLEFEQAKEDKGDFEGAMTYLQLYIDSTKDAEMKKQLEGKKQLLQKKMTEKIKATTK